MFQIELFPCPITAEDNSRTRRPTWGELIMLSNNDFMTKTEALNFAESLWIGTSARIFMVEYLKDICHPIRAWELKRSGFDVETMRAFPLRRLL